ncbi:hypothetical protein HZA40_00780 [Candidatus Peregrinibacteria bacterium]|nr:hypothetical protein [Candidatus Peregrinibacteria bacterium]
MDKKVVIGILVTVVIIALIIFGLKSCSPRTKVITSDAEEYSAFINANIEFTCMVIKDPKLAENSTDNQKKLDDIYAKYKLPADNNDAMMVILKKYADNTEVATIIQQNTSNCAQGGSPIFYQAA